MSLLDSNSDSSNFLDEWEERIAVENCRLDTIIEDLLLNNLNLNEEDSNPRAKRRNCERERELGEQRLMQDYFADNPTYSSEIFRRRFRMRKTVFFRIVEATSTNNVYFQQQCDATGRLSLSSLQKCTGAIKVLAYGTSTDSVDEYLRMSAVVTRQIVHFVDGIISCFGDEYLRKPNKQNLTRLLYVGEQRVFPRMICSIDCMYWEWKNCPTAWAGQYVGRSAKLTIILEAVASYDLWIWHSFFGTPEGRAPKISYIVNGQEKDRAYYLTDGIYPSWAAFVKSITSPQTRKHKLFAQHQEYVRKDVERAFEVLQARFAFIRRPCLVWDKILMGKIMMACIIMHNMIVEDERDTYLHYYDPTEFLLDNSMGEDQGIQYSTERIASLSSYMTNREQLRNREAHSGLKNDLIEHIWQKFGHDN